MFFVTGAPGALRRLFEGAGLDPIRKHRQSETLDFPFDHHVVEAVLLGGPVALAVKRFGEAIWAEVQQELLASVAEYRDGDGRNRIPGEFVTVTGVRQSI
jgi:hypothetical protein